MGGLVLAGLEKVNALDMPWQLYAAKKDAYYLAQHYELTLGEIGCGHCIVPVEGVHSNGRTRHGRAQLDPYIEWVKGLQAARREHA